MLGNLIEDVELVVQSTIFTLCMHEILTECKKKFCPSGQSLEVVTNAKLYDGNSNTNILMLTA